MKIIKRNGVEETFLKDKIANAILKANRSVNDDHKCPTGSIYKIASIIQCRCEVQGHTVTVEEVQDMVENELLYRGYFVLAKNYIKYRYKRQLSRKTNSTDAQILSLLECNN